MTIIGSNFFFNYPETRFGKIEKSLAICFMLSIFLAFVNNFQNV